MTTKVKIEIIQAHMPIVIEVLRSDGTIQYTEIVDEVGTPVLEYVHSSQTLRIREMTTAEQHEQQIQYETPERNSNG